MLLLLLLLCSSGAAEPSKSHCSSGDNFAMNVYALVMQPLVDRTTFVMAPSASHDAAAAACHVSGETCEALGVVHGINVLQVWLRILLGWGSSHCVFDACPKLSTVAALGHQEHAQCRLATRTMRCAWEHWIWGAAYVLLAMTLLGSFLFMAALSMCAH